MIAAEPLALLEEDLTLGEALRDEGMRLVTGASEPEQVAHVDKLLAEWAASGRAFSANDIRPLCHGIRPRLLGARFHAAQRAGLIVATGQYVKSTLPSTRAHVIACWIGADTSKERMT